MRVFVTGASGWIGSALVPELRGAGHEVLGLARSDASAAALAAAGADVQRGSLEDLDSLRAGAEQSDAVIHLAFIHDFSNFAHSAQVDRAAVDLFGDVLAGSDRPLLIASGTLGQPAGTGGPLTERDTGAPAGAVTPRFATAQAALALADRGVRSGVVRLAPTVHGDGDHGFVPRIVATAREKGVSGYVGDGSQRWPGVHVRDAATVFRLGVEQAPAGSVLHAIADEGVPVREIAEVIGRHLDVPVVSIAPEDAAEHFGFLGAFLNIDAPASSAITRELLGWEPTQPGLLDDLDAGHYFREAALPA